jgi:hypothetical protein
MNRRAADDRPGLPGGPAVQVEVTVIGGPPGPTPRQRLAGVWARRAARPIAFVAVLAATIAGFGAIASPAGRQGTAPARAIGPASAVVYPLRCVSEAIALHDPRFARAAFERTIPSCPPHNGESLDHDARPQ